MIFMDRARFETVVAQAIDALPGEFRDGLKNIAVTIEELPARGYIGRSKGLLLGLYQGVPLPERTHDYAGMPPDKITLYKTNIEAVCTSEEEMEMEIRRTLLHEVGHYFGLGERELRKLGY